MITMNHTQIDTKTIYKKLGSWKKWSMNGFLTSKQTGFC